MDSASSSQSDLEKSSQSEIDEIGEKIDTTKMKLANGHAHLRNMPDLVRSAIPESVQSATPEFSTSKNEIAIKIEHEGEVASRNRHSNEAKLLCLPLGGLPRRIQLVILAITVFTTFCIYAFFLELLFRLEGFKPFSWFITLMLFVTYTALSRAQMMLESPGPRKMPMWIYFKLAVANVGTVGLSNAALAHLNYPTQVMFKCCKLIPVLIGGLVIQRKKIRAADFVAAILMSIGLTLFTLVDSKVSPNFSAKGYALIAVALVGDAYLSNAQEKALKVYGASNSEVVFYSHAIGTVLVLAFVTVTGELFAALAFCNSNSDAYLYGLLYAIFGYFGVIAVITLIRHFGAFIAVTVTTLRKAVTICISFIVFAKPFTFQYVWSGAIVLLGVTLNDLGKFGLYDFLAGIQMETARFFRSHILTYTDGMLTLKNYSQPPKHYTVI